jgi:hypothetical protein
LNEISIFIHKAASYGFLKLLFTKEQRITLIEGYYRHMGISVQSFQVGKGMLQTKPLIDPSAITDSVAAECPCMAEAE